MRQSIVMLMGDDEFGILIKKSNSLSEVVRHFGLKAVGSGGFSVVKRRIKVLGLDCSHMKKAVAKIRSENLQRGASLVRRPLVEVLVVNSTYISTSNLKRRLLKEGLLEYKCSRCGIDSWNGDKLALQLEHSNGDSRDNRIENLKLLCPNCHSQTTTYAGKKNKVLGREGRTYRKDGRCRSCGRPIYKKDGLCSGCFSPPRKVKDRPSKEALEEMVWKRPTIQIAHEYGVSDKAVEKWCNGYQISKPPRGYWAKQTIKRRDK